LSATAGIVSAFPLLSRSCCRYLDSRPTVLIPSAPTGRANSVWIFDVPMKVPQICFATDSQSAADRNPINPNRRDSPDLVRIILKSVTLDANGLKNFFNSVSVVDLDKFFTINRLVDSVIENIYSTMRGERVRETGRTGNDGITVY
jgi:hypothetical protein